MTLSYVPLPQMSENQLALRPLSFGASQGNAIVPVVLTSGMTDEEINRVRAIMFPPPPPPSKVNLMANSEFIEVASVVAARLDHVRYERRKATIFTQRGVLDHCDELMRNVMYGEDKSKWPEIPFHINEWFSDLRGGDLSYDPTSPTADIQKTQFRQTMQIDWIQKLINQELETPGFCKVLFNCLELEEKIKKRLKGRHQEIMGTLGSASGFA